MEKNQISEMGFIIHRNGCFFMGKTIYFWIFFRDLGNKIINLGVGGGNSLKSLTPLTIRYEIVKCRGSV